VLLNAPKTTEARENRLLFGRPLSDATMMAKAMPIMSGLFLSPVSQGVTKAAGCAIQ
jgi:hypothetical protein